MFLSKRSNGFYYLFITDEITGKRKMISCKTKYKPEAMKFISQFKIKSKDLHKNNSVQVLHLSDLQREVLKYVSDNLRKSTCQIYIRVFNDMIRILGDKPLRLITISDIEKYKSFRLKEVAQTTINIELSTIKAIFNIGICFNWINSNPCNTIKKVSIPQKERLCFDETELALIVNNCKSDLMKSIIKFALHTGCRLNEILNVQWKDIDFEDRIINIRNKEDFKTKTGKQRQIPISDELFQYLNKMIDSKSDDNILILINPDKYIFSLRYGAKMRIDCVSKEFKKILRKINYPEKFHFHCLRHTFITKLIKSGVNINYVKEIAGHSDVKTTMNYIHIVTNDLREAMNKINYYS